MKKILITGVNSGLGNCLNDTFNKESRHYKLTRENRHQVIELARQNKDVDTIIHAAFGSQGGYEQVDLHDYFKYVDDNILLTKELLDIPHKRFIYISSLVVYETNYNNYKMTKLYCESMVKNLATNYLILRCPAILNRFMRPNNLIKIIDDTNPKLSLTEDSTFNYITDTQVADIISSDEKGVIDLTASKNIDLGSIALLVNKKVKFGKYKFTTPKIKGYLNKTSEEILQEFINTRKK